MGQDQRFGADRHDLVRGGGLLQLVEQAGGD